MLKRVSPKIGLALGSGGARGYCHIGVLQVLEENAINIDYISGCSMGALVGGAYASGVSLEDIVNTALTIKRSHLIDLDVMLSKRLGIMRGTRVLKIIKSIIPESQQIEETQIRFQAIASDIMTAKTEVLKKGPLLEAIRASIAVPLIFQPVRIGDKVLVDGGITNRVPIKETYDFGADLVVAVDPFGRCEPLDEAPKNILSLAERCFTIIDWIHSRYKMNESDFYLCPDMNSFSAFDFKNAEKCIAAGRASMEEALPFLKEKIALFKAEKTKK